MDFASVATQLQAELIKAKNARSGVGSQALTINSVKQVSTFVSAVDFLSYRTFQGLDIQTDVVEPSEIEIGRSGLARDYSELSLNEHEQ